MRALAIRINLLLILWMLASCSAGARQSTINGTFVGLNAARDAFIMYDLKHQTEIVDNASSRAEAIAQLEHYKQRRDRILQGFVVAYRTLAAAVILNEDPKSLPAMLAAFEELSQALKVFLAGGEP